MGAVTPAALTLAAACALTFVSACASEPTPASPALTEPELTVVTTLDTSVVTTEPATAPTTGAATETASVPVSTVAPGAVVPEGFERVQATVTKADGTVCELCLWLAATGEQRSQGLMFVTDLGDADGMAFLYDAPQTGAFWMKNTLLPLSIAFFSAEGAYIGAFDMEPCTADPCPTYPTSPDFTVAIETTQGNLAALGIEPDSVLELTDLPCA